MPILTSNTTVNTVNGVYNYANVGTAAGTTTICSEPTFLHAITITQRAASGQAVIYDSAGTSGTVIGTITLGTQTFSDPPPSYIFDIRTKNALTISNSGNLGLTVSSLK